jgi:hypothetical protein
MTYNFTPYTLYLLQWQKLCKAVDNKSVDAMLEVMYNRGVTR